MKAKEFIYNLRTNLEEMDSQIQNATDQHLMFMLDEARSILASRKMDKRDSVNLMTQHVDIKPISAPKTELGTIGSTRVLKLSIPKPINYSNGEAIFTVGPTDGQDSYSRITYSQLRTALFRKYTANTPKWLWFNDSVYVINCELSGLEKLRVRGIFAEPHKVIQAAGLYKRLDPFNWDYPASIKDIDAIYKIALSGDLSWGDTAAQAVRTQLAKQQRQEQREE